MKHLFITICLVMVSLASLAQSVEDYTITSPELSVNNNEVKGYKKAAKKGNVIAQRKLGMAYFNGNGIKQDKKDGYKWLLMAALGGDPMATYLLGRIHVKDADFVKGSNSFIATIIEKEKANQTHAGRASEFSRIYKVQGSYSVPRYEAFDAIVANDLYRLAAKSNNIDIIMLIAKDSQSKNLSRAVEYYSKAAELGNSEAQYLMGYFYFKGQGISKDKFLAHLWLDKAIAQNHPKAQSLLNEVIEEERQDSIAQAQLEEEVKRQDSIAQAQREEEERLRLEEERRKQALLAKGTMLLPYNELREVKNYHFLGNSYSSETKLLKALCKNDVVSYAGMQNADNLDRAAYLQSNQYQIDKQKLEKSREDVFVSIINLTELDPIIYEADGFKVKLYPYLIINNFKNDYLYMNGFIVPTKSCTIGGFHYFKSKNIAALQKIKQSEQKGHHAELVLLCKPGFNVDNTHFPKYIVRPTALYITDSSTNEILMDLSQYLRTIDTKAEKQQIISQVKNDIYKQEKYRLEADKKYNKILRSHFRAQCGECGGLGYVKRFNSKERCTLCYGRGYIDY